MRTLFPALLADVIRRCDLLDRRLAAAQASNALVAFQVHVGHLKSAAIRLEARAAIAEAPQVLAAVGSPEARGRVGGEDPYIVALRHYQMVYEDLSRRIGYCERFLLTPVEHHNPRLTRICQALTREIRWPQQLGSSLVGAYADSEDGSYWTVASLRVVGAPVGEAACLLGLPDLCHELGHHLAEAHTATLIGDFPRLFARRVGEWEALIGPQADRFGPLLDRYIDRWRNNWLYEFVSDIVGAYLSGPEFGWQHIRLCASNPRLDSSDLAALMLATHPHDDVRIHAITRALRLMGAAADADEIDRVWGEYAEASRYERLRDHGILSPPELVDGLVSSTLAGCRTLGLRRFDEADIDDEAGIVPLMRRAWRQFRDSPSGYQAWERRELDALWGRLLSLPELEVLPGPDTDPAPR